MASKYIYLGQDWNTEDLNGFGIGSVYLAGPRNKSGKSWRLDLIKKIERFGLQLTFLIPETSSSLNYHGNCDDNIFEDFEWQRSSIACTTAILFWFPLDAHDSHSLVEFGCWCKSERVFVGGEPSPQTNYLDFIIHTEQKIHAANTLDQLTENFVQWIIS